MIKFDKDTHSSFKFLECLLMPPGLQSIGGITSSRSSLTAVSLYN